MARLWVRQLPCSFVTKIHGRGTTTSCAISIGLATQIIHIMRNMAFELGQVEAELRREKQLVEWLREALRAVLVKSSAQAETFDEIFAIWATELLDRELPPDPVLLTPDTEDALRPQRPTLPPPRPFRRAWLRRHGVTLLVLLLGLCATGLMVRWLLPQPIAEQPDAGLPQALPDLSSLPIHAPQIASVWAPSILVEPQPLPSGVWRGSVALLGGLVDRKSVV